MSVDQSLRTKALAYHQYKTPGKLSIQPTKPLMTQQDLALAYSPGVGEPVKEIHKDVNNIYKYTAIGNLVAVISNGSAILGLGNLGPAASKPVMEGKAVLFKRFADIDAIDLEVNTLDPNEFISTVANLRYSFGGINLEDIKAPECFDIEEKLKDMLDIPVFHDDQHGTAIIVLAGLINAALIVGKNLEDLNIVVNGAGAAAIACLNLLTSYGVNKNKVVLCDTRGVVYKGRKEGMNRWKDQYATTSNLRSLDEAIKGSDFFLGLSAKGALTASMVKSMAPYPIIFALANPDPEITPQEVKEIRDDAIIATGRSDYSNQVNNLMCFPYIFRGALDVRAKEINHQMKIAAALALAEMAREIVPTQVFKAMSSQKVEFGPDYIIPSTFDPRLISYLPLAVAKAAIDTGVAGIKDFDLKRYKRNLLSRLNPSANYMTTVLSKVGIGKKVILAEGEEIETIRAAVQIRDNLHCSPILIGCQKKILPLLKKITKDLNDIVILDQGLSANTKGYIEFLCKRLQRSGYSYQDCVNLVKYDRNIFAACELALGFADSLIVSYMSNYDQYLMYFRNIVEAKEGAQTFKYYNILDSDNTIMVVDSSNDLAAQDIVGIILNASKIIKNLGFKPRVALISNLNFLAAKNNFSQALEILDTMKVDFEYEGLIAPDVALNINLMKQYPSCRLTQAANILLMPNSEATEIALKLLSQLLGSKTHIMGPILSGFSKNIQLSKPNASDILNMAAISLVD